jgi:predicted HicB family RNase H-like nuclease
MSKMMEYNGYHAQIEYDSEDEIFVGKVYGITDSLNFHGTSVGELEEMFHQSIDNYLQMCANTGKTPDKEFKGTFNIRISPELHRGISLQAAQQGISLNQYVLNALENSLPSTQN